MRLVFALSMPDCANPYMTTHWSWVTPTSIRKCANLEVARVASAMVPCRWRIGQRLNSATPEAFPLLEGSWSVLSTLSGNGKDHLARKPTCLIFPPKNRCTCLVAAVSLALMMSNLWCCYNLPRSCRHPYVAWDMLRSCHPRPRIHLGAKRRNGPTWRVWTSETSRITAVMVNPKIIWHAMIIYIMIIIVIN